MIWWYLVFLYLVAGVNVGGFLLAKDGIATEEQLIVAIFAWPVYPLVLLAGCMGWVYRRIFRLFRMDK